MWFQMIAIFLKIYLQGANAGKNWIGKNLVTIATSDIGKCDAFSGTRKITRCITFRWFKNCYAKGMLWIIIRQLQSQLA